MMRTLLRKLRRAARMTVSPSRIFDADFAEDGLAVNGKNLGFLDEPRFKQAWEFSAARNKAGWKNDVPMVRWRVHTACWAAAHAAEVDGDFAEFGVHTGIMSLAVCRFLEFGGLRKTFFLYDTFAGIPIDDDMSEAERINGETMNRLHYFDCYDIARANFSEFPNARLIRGVLPGTIDLSAFDRLAFAHIDLNNAPAEMQVAELIWDRLSPGGIVLLDDYAFKGFERQHESWNDFSRRRAHPILTLPTGQGLIIRR